MKKSTLLILVVWFAICVALSVTSCGGTGEELGGTETGTTESGLDTTNIAGKIESTANALVPLVIVSDADQSASPGFITRAINGTSEEWDTYLDPTNVTVLTDVFGDPDEDPAPVTRIRVLMDDFRNTLDAIFPEDPDIACEGANPLTSGDTLDVAFYDSISNGTTEDRHFDCITEQEGEDNHYVTLYGVDSTNVVRVASMMDVTNANIWFPEERGNFLRNLQVVIATYAESGEGETTVGYLDIQYAQASIYSGLDDDLEAEEDNVLFKSRTRITGRATLDESGTPVDSTGDFVVTKYDRGAGDDETFWESVTKTNGRGSYGEGEYSLFKIDSNTSSLEELADTFCTQFPEDGTDVPAYADPANCSVLETALAWGDVTFPFDLEPALSATFDDNESFEEDEGDLISNDGSNFEIPTY